MAPRPLQPPPYTHLSSPLTALRSHYDAVVIGSGYGGAIAACRLAEARKADGSPLRVCVLERGREMAPGEFPTGPLEFSQLARLTTPAGVVGPQDGLFDFRAAGDLTIIRGCGLGGTSLINAGVAIEPEPWVFQDEVWPTALRQDLERLHAGMKRARTMLGLQPFPSSRPEPKKLTALRKSAEELDAPLTVADVAVTFEATTHPAGLDLHACTGCGDCVMGCNRGAKNSTQFNYLPMAWRHGAEIFTQMEVRQLERGDGKWIVHFQPLGVGRDGFTAEVGFVSADVVVLGAGTVGTNEILLRSKDAGLPLSDRLGERFSGNGDVLAFGYNTEHRIDALGTGAVEPEPAAAPGPCISGIIDLRGREERPEYGMVIMEGVVPATFAPAMPVFLQAAAGLLGEDTDGGLTDEVNELGRQASSLLQGARHGATANTQTYLVMCHDDSGGRLELDPEEGAVVRWPGAGEAEYLEVVDQRLRQATAALGGTHVPNPVWTEALGKKLVTCHPLGGAAMGEAAERGVTDERGRVYAGWQGTAVHPGLYVTDAAVIPRSLGCNPLLTISALAERTMELLVADHGWHPATSLPPPRRPLARKLGLRFTERMAGRLGLGDDAAFDENQMPDGVPVYDASFVITAESDDLDQVLEQPGHRAPLSGTFHCEGLHPDPLEIDQGHVQFFVADPDAPDQRLMRYRFSCVAEDGRSWFVDGEKIIGDDTGMDAWRDTTTLYVVLRQGRDGTGQLVGRGILRVHLGDLLESMGTIEVLNARNAGQQAQALARTARFFFGELAQAYLTGN